MSEWTDSDGNSLGRWVEIDPTDYWEIYARERDNLVVFESLTDPDGEYGPRQVYTAWGFRGAGAPLIDIRDYKNEAGVTIRQVCRKFVPARSVGDGEEEARND